MYAGTFIAKREQLIKAAYRGIIDIVQYRRDMHELFVDAQVSRGICDDYNKADELLDLFIHNVEQSIHA